MLGNEACYLFLDLREACLVFSVEYRSGDKLTDAMEFIGIETTRGTRRGANANTAGYEGRTLFIGDSVLVHRQAHGFKKLLCVFAGNVGRSKVYQNQVIVGAARYQTQAAFHHAFTHRCAVLNHVFHIRLELGLQSLAESNGLCRNNVHQRTALRTREYCRSDFLRQSFVVGE